MSISFETRQSDSPFVETITTGQTLTADSPTRPAEVHWHMVISKWHGNTQFIVVGPWSKSGVVTYPQGAEILWIKLKLGVFMPHLPTRSFSNCELSLPDATSNKFWLNCYPWQIPDYANVDTFIAQLVREDILQIDPIVSAAMQQKPLDVSPRTLRHRFLRTTGMSYNHIKQVERAQKAAVLLQQGTPILDTVYLSGYYDQSHLTRSLKQFIGYTPSQILQSTQSE